MSPGIGDKKQPSNMNPVYLVSLSFNFSIYEMGIKYEPYRFLNEKLDNVYKMLTRCQTYSITDMVTLLW